MIMRICLSHYLLFLKKSTLNSSKKEWQLFSYLKLLNQFQCWLNPIKKVALIFQKLTLFMRDSDWDRLLEALLPKLK
jgi:hypothetical protein